ncbi:hypothetical protein G5C66_03405 [Nocardioides sp. KC13]|uniref:Uncharacterized protein n=1 Tax=Nocardioides turkmenicus TaxID=2711220 RepID=A0A6M1R5S4_9ACTN|nr:hypothetical protein [Nocardioides sp. KC13]NGN91787.1 hypothetical protein [Nocardioides sp. KC13]
MPPAPNLGTQGGWPSNENSFAPGGPPPTEKPHNPWPIVIGLGAIAVVLVIGVIVTAAIVILRGEEDPTAGPGPVTVTATPTTSPDPSSAAPAPGGLAADLFEGDWRFKLGDVSMNATYVASQDYPDCGPIASAALDGKGCRYAAMGIHDAEGGKLRMLRVIYVFGSEAAATAAAESVKETDIDLPTGSLVQDDVIGKWVAKESAKAVVVGFVTGQKGVSETTVDDYLHYGTADIAGALIFMDL